jgi:hypothetical protein
MVEPMPVAGEQHTRRKNAGRPRGRRALLWAAGLFVASEMALGLFLAAYGAAIRDPVRYSRMKHFRDRMAEAASPPKVVVLAGSSHVETGLRARLTSVHASEALGRPVVVTNQATPAGGAFRSLLAVDRLLRDGVVPDLLVLETFPALFSKTPAHDDATEVQLPLDQLDEADVELIRRHYSDRPDLGIARHVGRLVPGYHHHANLLNSFAPWLLPGDRRRRTPPEDIYHGDGSPEQRAKGVAHARSDYHPRLQNLSFGDPRQVGALDELVERARAEGTKVVFLATPEGPAFRSWYPPDRWARSVAWLRELAARRGVPLIDAREWTDREEWFNDSHHLNETGSEEFARWFAREVLVPQLRPGE